MSSEELLCVWGGGVQIEEMDTLWIYLLINDTITIHKGGDLPLF